MAQKQEKNKGLIKSVQKSLKILKYIIDYQDEVSLADIEKDLGYNVSTAHHLLKTLMEEGFVSQNRVTRKYDIGPEIFFAWLGQRKPEKYFYRATPILEDCVKATGETTNLFIRDGDEAVCITGCESTQTLRAFLKIGRRIPLTCTAAGKAFLAYLSNEELNDILNRVELKKYLSNTITGVDELILELNKTRKRGYAIEKDEYEESVTVIGVPIFGKNDRVICTLSSISPSIRTDEEKIREIAEVLKEASIKITKELEGTETC